MKLSRTLGTTSKRGLRVILFTWLLVTLACQCGESTIENCLQGIDTLASCYVGSVKGCRVRVSYLPPGSGSTGCSGNPQVVTTTVDPGIGGKACIAGCEKICSTLHENCTSSVQASRAQASGAER